MCINEIREFAIILENMNKTYEKYAKSIGLSYTNLQILNLFTEIENCTQKDICEHTFLPKQTINTIITNFIKNGLIVLKEMPSNRKFKIIELTKHGREFIDLVFPKIREAEHNAMNKLTIEEREAFLKGFKSYSQTFSELINNGGTKTIL